MCAVLGGILGQELLKAVSGQGKPAQNVVLFDAQESSAVAVMVAK